MTGILLSLVPGARWAFPKYQLKFLDILAKTRLQLSDLVQNLYFLRIIIDFLGLRISLNQKLSPGLNHRKNQAILKLTDKSNQ